MSQHIQQLVGVQAGQIGLVQGQILSGNQITTGQMVMTSASNLIPQQQIMTHLVAGQTVQGSIPGSNLGTTTLAPGQEIQQIVASSTSNTIQHVISGQHVTAQTVQVSPQPSHVVANSGIMNQQNKMAPTQSVPPPSPSLSLSENPPTLITKQRMGELVREVDPNEQLDEDVEDLLMNIADDFIESTVNAACRLAKHRGSRTLDVKDIQIYLERNWHMWIPGYGTEELRPYKRAPTTEAHKQRLALLRKAVKKY